MKLFVLVVLCVAVAVVHGNLYTVEEKREESGGGPCNPSDPLACDGHGTCLANSTCLCDEEYAKANCTYRRKSKLVAFLLAFLVGNLGAGRFYLGYIWQGILKMFLGLCQCLPMCLVMCSCICFPLMFGGDGEEGLLGGTKSGTSKLRFAAGGVGCLTATIGTLLFVAMILGSLAWWLTDWILIVQNNLKDSDGYELYNDM